MCRDRSAIGNADCELSPGEGGFRPTPEGCRPRLKPARLPLRMWDAPLPCTTQTKTPASPTPSLTLEAHSCKRKTESRQLKARLSLCQALPLHSEAVSHIGDQDAEHTERRKSAASQSPGSWRDHRRGLGAQALKNTAHRDGERSIQGATAGAFVPAAAEMLGDSGNVDCALAAQADAVTLVG
jgi:hypothetical protein